MRKLVLPCTQHNAAYVDKHILKYCAVLTCSWLQSIQSRSTPLFSFFFSGMFVVSWWRSHDKHVHTREYLGYGWHRCIFLPRLRSKISTITLEVFLKPAKSACKKKKHAEWKTSVWFIGSPPLWTKTLSEPRGYLRGGSKHQCCVTCAGESLVVWCIVVRCWPIFFSGGWQPHAPAVMSALKNTTRCEGLWMNPQVKQTKENRNRYVAVCVRMFVEPHTNIMFVDSHTNI